MIGISDDESDSDSFNEPGIPEVKELTPAPPEIVQKRVKFPPVSKEHSYTFRRKPFGIDWTFTEGQFLVVVGTKPDSPAEKLKVRMNSRLVLINGVALRESARLQAQLKDASLPTKLVFLEYGHRVLNFFSPRPRLTANWHVYPEVSNVVAVCDVGMELDLRKVVDNCRNCQFDPGNKAVTVLMKLRNPPCNAMVFRTGRFNITGCRSEVSALIACRKIARRISKLYPQIKSLKNFQIKAVFGSADIGSDVILAELHEAHEDSSYNKDMRPNCIFYFAVGESDKEGTCEVSSKGKLNFMGLSSIDKFWQRTEELYHKVHPFTRESLIARAKLEEGVKREPGTSPARKRRKLAIAPAKIEPAMALPTIVKKEEIEEAVPPMAMPPLEMEVMSPDRGGAPSLPSPMMPSTS